MSVSCLLYILAIVSRTDFWLKKTSGFQLIIEVGLVEVVRIPFNIYILKYRMVGESMVGVFLSIGLVSESGGRPLFSPFKLCNCGFSGPTHWCFCHMEKLDLTALVPSWTLVKVQGFA